MIAVYLGLLLVIAACVALVAVYWDELGSRGVLALSVAYLGGYLVASELLRHRDLALPADVLQAAAAAPARMPSAPAAPSPTGVPAPGGRAERRVAMSRLRTRIAERMVESQQTAAMLTTFNEVDMSAILALRERVKDEFEKKHGARLGFMSFFVKACIQALKEIPAANGEIEGKEIVYKNYYHIGVAVQGHQIRFLNIRRPGEVGRRGGQAEASKFI